MSEPPLSNADRETMTAMGWRVDNPPTVAEYQKLKALGERIDKREFIRRMNNFEMQQNIEGKGTRPENDLGPKPPDRKL